MSQKFNSSIVLDSGAASDSGLITPQMTNATAATAGAATVGVDSNGKHVIKSLPTYTRAATARTLNTNFTPNSTKAVFVSYSVDITCALTLAGTQTGTVELRTDSAATPTTAVASISSKLTLGLGIVVGTTVGGSQVLSALIVPGDNVRLVTSGSASITITNQSEVTITP